MKICHVGPLDLSAGGPALSMYYTAIGLSKLDQDIKILCDYTQDKENLIGKEIPIVHWNQSPISPALYMPHIKSVLDGLKDRELFHIQGIWQYFYHQLIAHIRKSGRPYILTPRGALYPQALSKSSLKKKLSRIFYQDKDLQKASCVLVTCNKEKEYYRALGFTNPIAVIPNPIDVSRINIQDQPIKSRKIIGYLGRLHPRKHVERLLYAFVANRDLTVDVTLRIIGAGDQKYEHFLRNEARRLGLNNIEFLGFLKGEKKIEAIRQLSLLTLPSDFENFGNVISEALVQGVPVLTTHGAPWDIVETYHCGWWVEPTQEGINNGLLKMLQCSNEEISQMGINGKKMVQTNFAIEIIAQKHIEMYEWVLNRGAKPDFISLE